MKLSDPGAFFKVVRSQALLSDLSQAEVDGCNAILTACGAAGFSVDFTAYCLATAFHETAGTMQPISEYGGPSYFTRMYDIQGSRPAKARELGNIAAGDGAKFFGRGYVQLTGKRNYAFATTKLRATGTLAASEDLVATPELAKRIDVAAEVMVLGMRDGWFTGRKLSDDLTDSAGSLMAFSRSRDIINGTDKADKIAHEAVDFYLALVAGGWS